jgi:hypothetical protein
MAAGRAPFSRRIGQPLSVGEVLAQTTQIYGERIRSALGIGALVGGAAVLDTVLPDLAFVLVFALANGVAYAVAARVIAGDGFGEASAQVLLRAPAVAVLALVTLTPYVVLGHALLVFLVTAMWLGLVAFAIPASVVEPFDRGVFWRLAHALRRTLTLARADYVHAVGCAAALVLIYLVFGTVLFRLLVGFADNEAVAAAFLMHLVLAPFFFLGLGVLYFDQNARALSSPGKSRRGGRADADVHHHVEPERAGAADAPGEPRAAP